MVTVHGFGRFWRLAFTGSGEQHWGLSQTSPVCDAFTGAHSSSKGGELERRKGPGPIPRMGSCL